METNAELPNIGDIWENQFFQIKVTDILETKSRASGSSNYLVVGVSANTVCYFLEEQFVRMFRLIKSSEEDLSKEFELDQLKTKLNRIYKT